MAGEAPGSALVIWELTGVTIVGHRRGEDLPCLLGLRVLVTAVRFRWHSRCCRACCGSASGMFEWLHGPSASGAPRIDEGATK